MAAIAIGPVAGRWWNIGGIALGMDARSLDSFDNKDIFLMYAA